MFTAFCRALTVCTTLLTLAPATSQATTSEKIQRVVEILKTKELHSNSHGVREYLFKIGTPNDPDSATIRLVYGVLYQSENRAVRDAEMIRLGMKPLPDTPAFAITFPILNLCIVYLIDADLRGTVTHSGQICAGMAGFIGAYSGPAEEFFSQNGGAQAMFDRILDKALVELR